MPGSLQERIDEAANLTSVIILQPIQLKFVSDLIKIGPVATGIGFILGLS